MKDLKQKTSTAIIVAITVILGGVAIFTAFRLYQSRKISISPTSPESQPKAWDCKNYTFSVSSNGVVTASNQSSRNEPPQQAKVYINENLEATFDVPTLSTGQSATLGTVQVPSSPFNWRVVGTKDCSSSGTSESEVQSCQQIAFTITRISTTPTATATPTNTPTATLTPTPSPTGTVTVTPTDEPRGGGETPTPTQEPTSSPTPTDSPGTTNSPTPTSGGEISAISPTPGGQALPDAGISIPTILGISLGLLLIIGAVILAF